MTTTKDPAELAWEQHASSKQLHRLRLTPRTHHERERRIDDEAERDAFQSGYHAAIAQQEAAIRAAKREAIQEAETLAFQLYAHPHMSDVNLRSEVTKRLLAKYSDPEAKPNV